MKLYNTLSKQIEDFEPRQGNDVQMFVCGPTVYDLSHIGHAKTYVQFDVMARVLRNLGYNVNYIQNITDIDDKIIKRAAESSVSWKDLSNQFEQDFYKDMETLGNSSVSKYVRATDHIDDIIAQVKTLMDKGNAYTIEGDGIYFEIATFPEYGKLSGRQEVRENDAETRIDHSDQKRGWNDFCLWKFSKPGEPVWDAPFGEGRPGWHIEDTAITEHYFGPQYDIHGGAIDLIFPHHEAELTQMEAASGKVPFVKYWTHAGFLNIDDKKMGKSLGNFLTIRGILEKGYDPVAIRVLMLQSHYRSSLNFSWDNLDAAQNRLRGFRELSVLHYQPRCDESDNGTDKGIEAATLAIAETLKNDLDTPAALAQVNAVFEKCANGIFNREVEAYVAFLNTIDALFGLDLSSQEDIDQSARDLIAQRETARTGKDWAKSDEFRDELRAQGLEIRDTDNGSIWYRT